MQSGEQSEEICPIHQQLMNACPVDCGNRSSEESTILPPPPNLFEFTDGGFQINLGSEEQEGDVQSMDFDPENPPYDDPETFLAFLKWYHDPNRVAQIEDSAERPADYVYDVLPVAAEMIPTAIVWARKKGIDPRDLSPAQIVGVYSDSKRPEHMRSDAIEERYQQTRDQWKRNLEQNEKLEPILCPQKRTFIHATGRFGGLDAVNSILQHGLDVKDGSILGTAGQLEQVKLTGEEDEIMKEQMLNTVRAANIEILSSPHKGYQGNIYEIIIQLPDLTDEQAQEMRQQREGWSGANGDSTQFYITHDQKSSRFVLDPQYIMGYVDLETGEFHRKDNLNFKKR
jgi:hypothetical protein